MNTGSAENVGGNEPCKKYVMLHGRRMEYEVWGEGEPFVFLHGMGGSIQQIRNLYDPISGIKLIVPNQQGHGGSEADWEHFDFDHLADDVIGLLEELNIETAYFAGISMGAAVCLNLAVRYPGRVRKLLLIRNAWMENPMPEGTRRAYADLGNCLREGGLEAFYQTEGWKLVSEASPYTRNAFTCTFEEESCRKYWQTYLILPGKTPVTSAEQIQSLKMPVFIVANRNDLCHPFEYGVWIHKLIPRSRFYEVPDKDRDGEGHKRGINQVIREMV